MPFNLGRLVTPLLCGSILVIGGLPYSLAQEPSPETGATLFPSGAFLSYNSVFASRTAVGSRETDPVSPTIRPTLAHEARLTFGWGFRRDFQLTALVPIITNHLSQPFGSSARTLGGTGLGDTLLLLKHRFLRLDSERGTTQASVTIGPKLPTGRTNLRDNIGRRLPASLQPGSGSTDLFLGLNGTYTGLFHIKRLVADESLTYLLRREGNQQTRLGDFMESRFWLSYRPYQSPSVGTEWWVGPALTWQHMQRDRFAGQPGPDSGGDVLYLGLTTYFSPHAGTILWLGADFPVTQHMNGVQSLIKRRISFGITKQFSFHRLWS